MATTIDTFRPQPTRQSLPSMQPMQLAGPLTQLRSECECQRLRLARERGLTAEAEAPGGYLIRDPSELGVGQIATPIGCACRAWQVWRRCEHTAFVRTIASLKEGIARSPMRGSTTR